MTLSSGTHAALNLFQRLFKGKKQAPAIELNRILIVDDDMDFAELVKHNLEAAGDYSVGIVGHPKFAIEAGHEFLPDLFILDLIMPGMDGADLTALIERDPVLHRVPILYLSSLVDKTESNDGLVIREDGRPMLGKPVSLARLKRALARLLD